MLLIVWSSYRTTAATTRFRTDAPELEAPNSTHLRGEFSKHHPHVKVLNFLNEHRDDIRWARTDRNGLVTITFSTQGARVKKTSGDLNDPRPNSSDTSIGGAGGPEEPFEWVKKRVEPRAAATDCWFQFVEVKRRFRTSTPE